MRRSLLLLLTLMCPAVVAAQSVASLVSQGRAMAAFDPARALALFRQALELDSLSYEANWRAAVALVELGLDTPDSVKSAARDSLYLAAEHHASRAVAADTTRPEGFFALSMALGRVALTKSRKDRVGYAAGIYESATRALTLAPDHDGAHHVLGLWHAEGRRTSGFNRFLARNLLGGGILGKSNWDSAIVHLEEAVRLDPSRIYHRLDLAEVYADRKRFSDARRQLAEIARLPDRERHDPGYRKAAERLERDIQGKRDERSASDPGQAGASRPDGGGAVAGGGL